MNALNHYDNDKLCKIIKVTGIAKGINNEVTTDKLHEIVYILKSLGEDFKQNFKFEYSGPYSLELQIEVEELINQHVDYKQNSSNDIGDKIRNANVKFDKLLNELTLLDDETLKLIATIYYLRNIDYADDIIEKKLEVILPYFKTNFKTAISKYQELKTVSI